MNNDSPIYNRVGHVELLVGNNLKRFDGLDFKFNITKTAFGNTTNADIGILGLNRAHIQYLSTFLSSATTLSQRKRIKVYAGYEHTGELLLFDGDIAIAQPSLPPDNWMNIRAYLNGRAHTKLVNLAINGDIRYGSLIDMLGKYLGLKVEWHIDVKHHPIIYRKIHGFDCVGNKGDLIDKINSLGDLQVTEDGDTLYVGSKDLSMIVIKRKYKLSYKTGMIGIPKYTFPCVKVSALINNNIKLWDVIDLHSEYVPGADGEYIVKGISYSGQLRSDAWKMELSAINYKYWLENMKANDDKRMAEADKKLKEGDNG